MQIAMVGLGRMGANMTKRLIRGGHDVVVFDRDQKRVLEVAAEGAQGAESPADLVQKLGQPRAIWIMVPAGAPTEQATANLRLEESFADKMLSAMRQQFGGHMEQPTHKD